MSPTTANITGAASGVGLECAQMLLATLMATLARRSATNTPC